MRIVKHLMRRLFGGGARKPKSERGINVQEQEIQQRIIRTLLTRYGLRPVYVAGVSRQSELNQKAQELPLFYVWGQKATDQGLTFTFGMNGLLVSAALAPLISPGQPNFTSMKAAIERKLHKVAYDALIEDCERLNLSPRELLETRPF